MHIIEELDVLLGLACRWNIEERRRDRRQVSTGSSAFTQGRGNFSESATWILGFHRQFADGLTEIFWAHVPGGTGTKEILDTGSSVLYDFVPSLLLHTELSSKRGGLDRLLLGLLNLLFSGRNAKLLAVFLMVLNVVVKRTFFS